jgi:hypothetical protein
MPIKTEKDLSETQRSHWLKAVAAIELRNFGYAVSLLQAILKQEPEFLTGRQLLRRTEVTKNKAAKKSFFNISTAPIAVMKAQREMKKDPKRYKNTSISPRKLKASCNSQRAWLIAAFFYPACCR